MADLRALVLDPDFDRLSSADKFDVLTRAGAPQGLIDDLVGPQGKDTEGLVSDLSGGGFDTSGIGPYRTLAELPVGMAKSLSRNLLGGLKLNPVSLISKAVGGPDPAGDVLEKGREALAPQTVGEEKAADIEQLLEFLVPGPGKASSLLGTIAKGAAEAGLIGSAQKGEVDPGSAVGGGLGVGLGKLGVGALGRIAARFFKRAPETIADLAGAGGGEAKKKAIRGAEGALDAGAFRGFLGADDVAARAAARTDELRKPLEEFHQVTDPKKTNVDDLVRTIRDAAGEEVETGAFKEPFVQNKLRHSELTQLADELLEMRKQPKGATRFTKAAKVPRGQIEDKLRALDDQADAYARKDPSKAREFEGNNLVRKFLDEVSVAAGESPSRAQVTKPFSDALSVSKGLEEKGLERAGKLASSAGEQFATRAGLGAGLTTLGAVVGGPAGAGAGLGAAAVADMARRAVNFVRSPAFRAMSAQQQRDFGRAVIAIHPELEEVITTVLRGAGGEIGADLPPALDLLPEEPR